MEHGKRKVGIVDGRRCGGHLGNGADILNFLKKSAQITFFLKKNSKKNKKFSIHVLRRFGPFENFFFVKRKSSSERIFLKKCPQGL